MNQGGSKENHEEQNTDRQTNGNSVQIISTDVNIPVVTQASDLLCLDT